MPETFLYIHTYISCRCIISYAYDMSLTIIDLSFYWLLIYMYSLSMWHLLQVCVSRTGAMQDIGVYQRSNNKGEIRK